MLILLWLSACRVRALFAWHIWRDRPGAPHSAGGWCHICSYSLDRQCKPTSHYNGETYLYCGPRATWHRGLSSAAACTALGVVLAAGVILLLAR